jgi:hypothetical protein
MFTNHYYEMYNLAMEERVPVQMRLFEFDQKNGKIIKPNEVVEGGFLAGDEMPIQDVPVKKEIRVTRGRMKGISPIVVMSGKY